MPRGFLVRRYDYREVLPLDLSLKSALTAQSPDPLPPALLWNPPPKKSKTRRKSLLEQDTSSPVSGTLIRSDDDENLVVRKGDIDPAYNAIEATEEAKAELAKIENRIGDYVCRLCKELYDDPFGLAGHRCSRIVHVEYKCPECEKSFNCPANLASHRRWHKPRTPVELGGGAGAGSPQWRCPACPKGFRKEAYLRKHLLTHRAPLLHHTPPPRLPFVATG